MSENRFVNKLIKRQAQAPEVKLHSNMMIFAFANAIRHALGTGVPCNLPYSDITLLQLIRKGHVKTNNGFIVFDDTHVLLNPGNPADTLQVCFKDNEEVLKKLGNLAEGESHVMPLDVKLDLACHASLTADDLGSKWLTARLLSHGFEVDMNQTWDLSICGKVKKRAVAATQLEQILSQVRVDWFANNVIGVVTAVYYLTGGLSYKGKVSAVAKVGADLVVHTSNENAKDKAESVGQTCTTSEVEHKEKVLEQTDSTNADASVAPTPGWKLTLIGNSEIELTERDPVNWIVAIEYLEVEAKPFEDDKDHWLELKTGDEVMKNLPF